MKGLKMKRKIHLTVVFAVLVLPALVYAQWSVAPHIVVSLPQSDFANVSGTGGGIGIKGVYRFPSLGGLSLRSDFGFISYGSQFESVNIGGQSIPARTRNESFRLTFGPEFSFGTSNIRLFGSAMGGFYFYRTSITVTTIFGPSSIGSENNEAKLGWNLGGGIQYDIGLGPWLEIAVEYHTIKNVSAPAEAQAGGDKIDTINIDAKDFTLKIGVVFFIGG